MAAATSDSMPDTCVQVNPCHCHASAVGLICTADRFRDDTCLFLQVHVTSLASTIDYYTRSMDTMKASTSERQHQLT